MVLGCENEDETPENPNHPSSISLSLSNNVLKWTMNKDDDFFGYSLIGSITTKRSPFSDQVGLRNDIFLLNLKYSLLKVKIF